MKTMKSSAHDQQGAMLLESLIAILIFSMGILAIIGLQAASVRMSGDAKYRTDANTLVNKIIGQMWVDDRTPNQLTAKYANIGGVAYMAWASEVQAALPGIAGEPANQPTIQIALPPVTNPNSPSSLVTVTVFWKLPGESQQNRHSATSIAQIR